MSNSCSDIFHGTAKLQKLSANGTIEDLETRAIVSKVCTASHYLANYLSKLQPS